MDLKIPPLPDTLGEVLKLVSDEASPQEVHRLVEIIRKDPATSIYVLRRINSPYHGLRRYVSKINQAVVLLGFKRVCNLVLAATLKQSFTYLESTAARNVYEHVMQTSLATAAFGRDLSVHLGLPFAETAFTAGLLHQLGRLVLLQSATQHYVSIWYEQAPGADTLCFVPPTREQEQVYFKADYPQLGAAVMRQWASPDELATVTGALFEPSQVLSGTLRTLTLAVAAGSAVAEALFTPEAAGASADDDAVPGPLTTLAQARYVAPQELADFLHSRHDAVRAFAESVLADL